MIINTPHGAVITPIYFKKNKLPSQQKIKLLVIPDLFPKYQGDVQGVFLLDYIKCAEPYANIEVLFVRNTGEKKGLTIEKEGHSRVYRYCLSDKKIPFYLKPLYYILWFYYGYQTGKRLEKPDIIHAHGTILSGTLSWLLSRHFKVPFIITEHLGPFSIISKSFWKRNWTRFTMKKANAVLTVSHHLKSEIEQSQIFPKKIIVTYNPVDTNLFRLKDDISLKKNMLFVGRLDNFKGALRCLQAFDRIHSMFPDWKLTIAGDGEDMPAIQSYLSEHHDLNQRVKIIGHLQKSQIVSFMHQADFLVFPSRHESFALVVAEAMSCGLPVITTNQTAPREYVSETEGILVSPDDVNEIAAAIQNMITHISNYSQAGIRQSVIHQFSFDVFGQRLYEIYQTEINSKN